MNSVFILKDNLLEGRPELVLDISEKAPNVISHAFFLDGYVYCCNGFIALRQKLEIHELEEASEILNGKMLHRDAIKALSFGASMFEITESHIIRHGGGMEIPHKLEKVKDSDKGAIETLVNVFNTEETEHLTTGLGINYGYFLDLCRALVKNPELENEEKEQVRLDLYFNHVSPVYSVTAKDIPAAYQLGVIMPVQFFKLW